MVTPYREPAALAVVPEPPCGTEVETQVRVGTGFLVRSVQLTCPRPGWWRRWLAGMMADDVWCCELCGQRWELYYYSGWKWKKAK